MGPKRRCIAPGCGSTSHDPGIIFHTLPSNLETRAKWLSNMGSPTCKVFEHSQLCSLHFNINCYERSFGTLPGIDPKTVPSSNRLKKKTIPTLFGTNIRKRNRSSIDQANNLGEPSPKSAATNEFLFQKPVMKSVEIQTLCEKKTLNVKHRVCQVDAPKMIDKSTQTMPFQSLMNSYIENDEVHYDYDEEADKDDWAKGDPFDKSFTPSELPEEDIFISREFDENLDVLADRKFIVFEAALLQLFKFCMQCLALCKISTSVSGTCLTVFATCQHQHTFVWKSQPFIGRKPAGNILTAAAILFSGMNPTKALRMLSFVGIQMYERTTFFGMQKAYLFRAIKDVWEKEQRSLLKSLRGKPLTFGGEVRIDSPGFCDKYGSYTFLENSQKKVVHFVLIQSNQVKNSVAMELEGFIQGLNFFFKKRLNVVCMVTNRHAQIRAYIKRNCPDMKHLFDCWHLVKSIKSKISISAKTKGCEVLSEWNRSIQNHIYWIANSSSGDTDLMRAKWTSLLQHVINKHDGHDAPFEKCSHAPVGMDERKKHWLNPLSDAYGKLSKIVEAYTKDIGFLSSTAQTSSVEAFHSVIIHFAPKNTDYSFHGMYARHVLAVLHFNENSVRIPATTKAGKRRMNIKPVMVGSTYEYVSQLMEVACKYSADSISEGIEKTILQLGERPAPICSTFIHPDKVI